MMLLLARAEWTLGIGDPTIIGWTVCAAYAYASWRCLTAGAQANTTRAAGLTRFWLACAFVLLLLSLNKQLDLQKIFTQMARALARERATTREDHSDRRELLLEPARADPEAEAAAGEHVEGGR